MKQNEPAASECPKCHAPWRGCGIPGCPDAWPPADPAKLPDEITTALAEHEDTIMRGESAMQTAATLAVAINRHLDERERAAWREGYDHGTLEATTCD